MKGYLRYLPLLMLPLLLLGCSAVDTLKERQLGKELDNTLKRYNATIRWGNPVNAYGFLKPEIAVDTPIPSGMDNIRITEYLVVHPPTFVDKTTATQAVTISYIFEDRQVRHSLLDTQIWKRDNEESTSWYRANPIPEFK
jgi:hypothetical protein